MARNTKPNNDPHRPMSIDAMLDMERQEVLALLENKNQTNQSPERVRRSASPYTAPRSPVRSMLDIAEEPADTSTIAKTKTSPPRQAPVRSMLDYNAPIPSHTKKLGSVPNSPSEPTFKSSSASSRSLSDTGFKPVDFGPRSSSSNRDPTSGYQFSDIYTQHSAAQQLPKRTSQKSSKWSGGSLGDALRGSDLGNIPFPSERGRHSSVGSRLGSHKSKSPHDRMANRSRSPATFASLPLAPGRAMLSDGQIVDISSAYRRLSDANLAFSSGSLSQLPMKKPSEEVGEGRLVKDYLGPDGEHLESSEDEDEPYSTDDEDRGRKKAPRVLNKEAKTDSSQSKSRSPSGHGERRTKSLLAAAEEERSHIASKNTQYHYKSLIEPEIKITNSSGNTVKSSKNMVHPYTSYDQGPNSATPSVFDSDEEAEVDDIRRAQKLSFTMSNVLSQPEAHRAIRIINRGDWNHIVQAAEQEHRRLRKYLVATDLSDESTHALEWAIGTVLRDGDTLIAIYCVDEEIGVAGGDGALIPDDPKAMREEAAALSSVANSKVAASSANPVSDFRRHSAFQKLGESVTPGSSPAPGGRSDRIRAEEDRRRAVRDITDRVCKLLRKTQLQVRVIVEVMHCKNPKHLITEVIDLVNPTLVVIGSRGRSALKGVILGSFSNYLVTKSSVPVMVARKRLRKQSKYRKTTVKQVNNLSNPTARSLAHAKID